MLFEPTFSLQETIQGAAGGWMNVSATTRVPPYEELLQRSPDVVVAHGRAVSALRRR